MDSESDETEDQEDQAVNSSTVRSTNDDNNEFDDMKTESTMTETEFCYNEEIRMINGGKQELLEIMKNYRKITFTRSSNIL